MGPRADLVALQKRIILVAENSFTYNKEFDCNNYSFLLMIFVVGLLSYEGER